jgi:AcrR family transcriptional regulator
MSTRIVRSGTEPKKRAPGRPRGFDTAEVLGRLRGVFMDKGFSAASLDDLAAAAGLNRPSLYAAFGNKEQLYLHVLRQYGEQGIAILEAILARTGPIEQRLGQVYDAAIGAYTAPPRPPGCMIIGTATAEAPTHPEIAAVATELLAAIEASLEKAFGRAVAAGELGPTPAPAARARLAGAVFDTLAVRARLGARPADLRAIALSIIPAICA